MGESVSDLFDVDARAASFKPVVIKFRGTERVLGATALSLIQATSIYSTQARAEGETDSVFAVRLVKPILRALSPELSAELDARDLEAGEELALLPVLTEVVKRLGAVRFSA